MTKDMTRKERLDTLIYDRGLAESREKARRLILAGQVEVEGVPDPKPGHKLRSDAAISVKAGERYVSRGGHKLEEALRVFQVDPAGLVCADIGASTGGFTDCLLQHGAARVFAVDVGSTQMHERLRSDPRVTLFERANAREFHESSFPNSPSLIVIDVSFISLGKVLPALGRAASAGAILVALVKPQFEATRVEVSRGKGIIRDPVIHARILQGILTEAPTWGWRPLAMIPSPIAGGSGNREYLMHAVHMATTGERERIAMPDIDIDALVQRTLMGK